MQTPALRFALPTLLLALAGCAEGEVRVVGDYDSVENRSDATMRMSESDADGDPETVEVLCGVGDPDVITVEADGEVDDEETDLTLVITADGDVEDCEVILDADALTSIDVRGNGDLVIEGTATALADVDIRGNGNLDVESIDTARFDLAATGNGELTVDELIVNELDLDLDGNSTTTLVGSATVGDFTMQGNSVLYASELIVDELDIEMSGSSTAEISVMDDVDAALSGNAILEVWGSTELDITDVVELGDADFVLN